MDKRCKGCGVALQSEHAQELGYTPKAAADYCQRCFRIRHYDDVTISMRTGIDPDQVLKQIAKMNALVLWVVDLFDFEANLIAGIHRHLPKKDILLVATKRDLLPDTLADEKLGRFLLERCGAQGIHPIGLVVCGDLRVGSCEQASIEEIKNAIAMYRGKRDVVIMGMANAGKSTLLNALLNREELTTSRYPGTTLDILPIDLEDYILYDTPGLSRMDSYLSLVSDAVLKTIVPTKRLKARGYQLYEDQSLAVGGLVRLDLCGGQRVSCVAYFAPGLQIHRGKQEKADGLWKTHMGELLAQAISNDPASLKKYTHGALKGKLDVVIHGLGWFCISGDVKQLSVYVDRQVDVTFRKAMI